MEKNIKKTIDVINDLYRINNDRVEGYKKAVEELAGNHPDLQKLFNDLIAQSKAFCSRLETEVNAYGGDVIKEPGIIGSIYRAWMDVKLSFSSNDRHTILESCEYGEDKAQKSYDLALEETGIAEPVISLILLQKSELRDAHNLVKKLRDKNLVHA